jgi:hypothetical protein
MGHRRGLLATALALFVADAPGLVPGKVQAPVAPAEGGAVVGEGLRFRLGEGSEETVAPGKISRVPAEPLADAETRAVLRRLPPFAAEPEARDFALREGSLPPPRTGKTIQDAFPPPVPVAAPEAAEAGPLSVLRHTPGGDVPLAPSLSVTFSQPMVAVSSHDQVAREGRPVALTPEPPGRWRWVGTKTLLFEPEGRFPMATDYRAEVPAGTRSAVGGDLAKAETWTFSTPAPRLVASHPVNGPVRRDALLLGIFDQKVDPQAVLLTVRVQGGPRLRLASDAELAADPTLSGLVKGSEPGRCVAFRSEAPLPPDTEIKVSVGPGTPSAEGPKRTSEAQSWSFRTYGPMRVKSHRCGWNNECPPFTPWNVELTNPVDAKGFRKEMVRVEPALPGMKVDVYGQNLSIRGLSKGRTTYRVTLSASMPDSFGQTLERDQTLTFAVGSAPQSLTAQGGDFAVLDPYAPARFSVYTVNHDELRVRIHAVTTEDWPRYREWRQKAFSGESVPDPPGRAVLAKTVPVRALPDELTETRIDLGPALQGGAGQLILLVEPTRQPKERWKRQSVVSWIQVTGIGLDAFVDADDLLAWASSLKDGSPLAGVEITTLPAGPAVTTASDGLARLPLDQTPRGALVARRGSDVALLPEHGGWWSSSPTWQRQAARDAVRFSVFDDRGLYRPGEEVRVKGWARVVTGGKGGDVLPLADRARTLSYTLRDSQGNEIVKGTRTLSAFGAFDLALKLPPTMNLGDAGLQLLLDGQVPASYQHAIKVQEFRRPEFEVSASASEGPHFVGDHATVTVAASYFAGGGLSDADVTWRVSSRPGSFVPPNRDDYTFGTWTPWWWEMRPSPERPAKVETFTSRTDASGRHRLRIDLLGVTPPRPTSLGAEATVMDVNRQAWTATSNLLVHPSSLYVGLKSGRLFVQKGEAIEVRAIVTDLDGKAVAGRPFSVKAERLEWEQEGGEWKEKPADVQDCRVSSAEDGVPCSFKTPEGGTYRITARVADEKGRANETEITIWVAGGKMPPRRGVEQEQVTLVPDKKEYRAGETAQVLVLAPFSPAEGLLTLRRSGLVRTERFTMAGTSHTVQVRIEEGFTPNVQVQVDLVGAAPRSSDSGEADPKLPKRPAYASGHINLAVPPYARTLGLTVTPRDKALEPGGQTSLEVRLKDAQGRPVSGGEVAVVVVDEAVLALTGYKIADPLGVFYATRDPEVRDHYLRASVLLARPDDLEMPEAKEELQTLGYVVAEGAKLAPPAPAAAPQARAKGMLAGRAAPEPEPIRMRTDFSALALFEASVPTDAQGRASVTVKLPDSLTRYRVMAIAAAPEAGGLKGNEFGSGESTITARLPLMVRPSPPRFLNFGDRFELPVVLQNQTDAPLSVDVAVRAGNADLTAGQGRRVSVPANDRVEVRFPAAARRAGTARFQVGAISGRFADAAEFQLPVWTPATTEAFATYGQIDQGAIRQPVQAPEAVVPEFGGLEVTTSSTALQALTDAVLYLVAYPFECAEQLSSRVLAVAALRDVLNAFQAEGLPKAEEMIAATKRDVDRLRMLQNGDGGFGFWRRGDESWPYVSIHVAHALSRAKEKGFEVPQPMLDASKGYLKSIDKRVPDWYDAESRRTLVAYALYVRNRLGDPDPGRARGLVREAGGVEKLSFEALAWLLPTLAGDKGSAPEAEAARAFFANRVTETASTAHFAVSYGDGAHLLLHSDRRADAVVLEALIGDQPRNDVIPKLVEGLLGHRKAGHWENTQENAFVLLALDRYFNAYEKVTPDFVARAWLGERYAGEHAFRGRSTDRHHVEIPMQALLEAKGRPDLVLAKDGPGRLYYRIGMRYAPASLELLPADHGFTVERAYEGVDDKGDVRRDAAGAWHVRAGSRVRVTLTMVAASRRYHVALVDPLPAGLESLNPALATTGSIPQGPEEQVTLVGAPGLGGPRRPGSWWWWTRTWYEHQNLRDERAEAFTSLLFEGVYSYSYVARATTPGAYVVPPTKAEEMYHPETFGRGSTDRLLVE